MKNPNACDEQFKRIVNKARNESQKSVLLCFVLDKTMSSCTQTVQHARELRNPITKRRRKAT